MKRVALLLVCAFVVTSIRTATAQQKAELPKGLRGEMIANANGVEAKVLDLVKAMPDDKFSWRPEEGVRSVSEVFLHIAGANYLFPSFVGVKMPEGMDMKKWETSTTDKAKISDAVKKSFESFRESIMNLSDADLDKTTKMFGFETTYRNVYLVALTHMHEHLGQSIAYARTNHVTPPWTAEQQEKAKKAKTGM
ncbi:MAG TPA: DinB family protein [Bacteroidota bacterium]